MPIPHCVTCKWYRFIWLLVLIPAIVLASNPVVLLSMRTQTGPTSSRFIFMLSQKTTGKVKYIPSKNELLVDFANTRKRFIMQNVKFSNANVTSITTVELPQGGLRFIIVVKGKIHWKIEFQASKDNTAQLALDIISEKAPVKVPVKQKTSQALKKIFAEGVLKTYNTLSNEAKTKTAIAPAKIAPSVVKKPRVFTIVIDAGHGGKDRGASGISGTHEKDVVLAIAKRLANKINGQPNLRAKLTREGDYFVPLRSRLRLARKDNADLFVAIHADAYFDNNASGVSVYALSKRGATTEAARWLAQRENYAELDEVELNALKDRSMQLRSVLIDLSQTTTIRDSLRLGNKILDALDDISLLRYKHVQQAPFVVLKSPDIPSILVETGFISNPQEEKRLADVRYQEKLAEALCRGIALYVKTHAVLE